MFSVCAARSCLFNAINPVSMQPFVKKLYAFPFGAHVHLLVISNDRDMTFLAFVQFGIVYSMQLTLCKSVDSFKSDTHFNSVHMCTWWIFLLSSMYWIPVLTTSPFQIAET
jgi:hypothetical protein